MLSSHKLKLILLLFLRKRTFYSFYSCFHHYDKILGDFDFLELLFSLLSYFSTGFFFFFLCIYQFTCILFRFVSWPDYKVPVTHLGRDSPVKKQRFREKCENRTPSTIITRSRSACPSGNALYQQFCCCTVWRIKTKVSFTYTAILYPSIQIYTVYMYLNTRKHKHTELSGCCCWWKRLCRFFLLKSRLCDCDSG